MPSLGASLTTYRYDSTLSPTAALITQSRYRTLLRECDQHLATFQTNSSDIVIATEEVRLAIQKLGEITGRVGVEEMLSVIFKSFCIGK